MAQILVTKPGVLNQRDRAALRKAAVICVEAENPTDIWLMQAEEPELSPNDMLFAAVEAVTMHYESRSHFAFAMHALMKAARAPGDGAKG